MGGTKNTRDRAEFQPDPRTEPKIRRFLDDETLSPGTRSEMARYSDSLLNRGFKVGYRRKEIQRAHRFLLSWGRPEVPDVDGVGRFLGRLRGNGMGERTLAHHAGAIKRFYTWRNNGDEPPTLRRLSTASREKRRILPFWTWEDVEKMLAATDRPRDRAIIIALMESGARAEEFMALRMKDLRFAEDNTSVRVHLPTGKTGEYTQVWVRAVPYLLNHLRHHPAAESPEAPLWPAGGLNHGRTLQPLKYPGLYHLLATLGDAAGVPEDRRSPHAARRGNATWLLSQGWSKEKVNMWQGREPSSRLIDTYSQDFDLSQEMLRMSGLAEAGPLRQNGDGFKPVRCGWCGGVNEAKPAPKACLKCGKPLTLDGLREREERTAKDSDFLARVGEAVLGLVDGDPKLKEALRARLGT